MKKSVKVALKRFVILLLCLLMALTLFAVGTNKDLTVTMVVGIICAGLVFVYWVWAIILIRRDQQKDDRKNGKK